MLAHARAGDDRAFGLLIERHARGALAVARGVVHDPDLAEDVCQEALFRIWQRLDHCREPERFAAWLGKAVHRHALNALRGRRRTTQSLDPSLPGSAPSPDREVIVADARSRLDRALAGLTAEQREAVLLFDLEGWSHSEIAETLGTTEAMSRQHLMLGRRRLRELLPEKEEG